jgi:hypothetical protein
MHDPSSGSTPEKHVNRTGSGPGSISHIQFFVTFSVLTKNRLAGIMALLCLHTPHSHVKVISGFQKIAGMLEDISTVFGPQTDAVNVIVQARFECALCRVYKEFT